MAEGSDQPVEQVDNWVFDSLVNFLHGSIWKVPVVGFIEEKSVVFDPDSYNNMTEEKEQEFRKIHEEYKGVVDFMLGSFMEDLQVTPEQVEEACRVREHQNKALPESHITKVALEQLWAAEDFTAFRRLMTRKNIDLQLQSLELLVAKYGILSPALRSGDSEEPAGEDGEDDFLQVVIRYSDQLELFKCDYGPCCPNKTVEQESIKSHQVTEEESEESKNMKLHLSGIKFKNDVAPTPIQYQATLTSSSSSLSSSRSNPVKIKKQYSVRVNSRESMSRIPVEITHEEQAEENSSKNPSAESLGQDLGSATPPPPPTTPSQINEESPSSSLSITVIPEEVSSSLQESQELENEPRDNSSPVPKSPSTEEVKPAEATLDNSCQHEIPETDDDANVSKADIPSELDSQEENILKVPEEGDESQLIQLEETEANLGESKEKEASDAPQEQEPSPAPDQESQKFGDSATALLSPTLDEKTGAEIVSTAPEQRRLLTAVRKALEVNPDESETNPSIDIPSSLENDVDLQKRREYLRAQRDKLIAIKKQEREKLLMANAVSTGGEGQPPARPKSARAAQMALKNPNNMRAASLSEKSLSARRALADRLKQELIEK